MSSNPNQPQRGQTQAGEIQVASKRVFSSGENTPPQPVYMNGVEFTGLGMDIFMDVGTISPEAIQAAVGRKPSEPDPNRPVTVDFNVNYRFAMTVQTAAIMHQKLSEIISATKVAAEGMPSESRRTP